MHRQVVSESSFHGCDKSENVLHSSFHKSSAVAQQLSQVICCCTNTVKNLIAKPLSKAILSHDTLVLVKFHCGGVRYEE